MVKVLNVNFNNISAISWRLALLVEETEVPRFQLVLEYSDIQVLCRNSFKSINVQLDVR